MRRVARGIRERMAGSFGTPPDPGNPQQLVRRYKGSIRLGPGPCRTAESRVTSSSSTKNIPSASGTPNFPLNAMVSVVPKIAAEKKRGSCKRRKHANLMSLDFLTTDKEI